MKEALNIALDALRNSQDYKMGRAITVEAVEIIEEALAQPDNTAKLYEELRSIIDGGSESFTHDDAVQYLKDKLAQPEQEPVAWAMFYNGYFIDAIDPDEHARIEGDYKHALYTTPPQRTWVGLTDREKSNLWLESRAAIPRFHTYATLVEAKLKENNT